MSTRGRVTILGLNYAPEPTGNAPYTTGLARHLQSCGHPVTVLTSFPHYPQWRRYTGYSGWRTATHDDGVRLVRLKHWIPNPPRGLRRLVSELTFGVRLAFSSWQRPETVVLVTPALFASWLAMLRLLVQRGPRRIVWVQDLYSQGMEETGEGGGVAQRVARTIEGWTLRRAHTVVAIHETMAARMAASLRVERTRIVIVPNWTHVEPAHLSRTAARKRLGWAKSDFVAVHAGNIGAKQGLDNVIEAARLASALGPQGTPPRFVLIGDGSERARLEGLAANVPTVTFADPLEDDLFMSALAAADILLVNELPGVREMAVPSKLTTYFATSRPVVAAVDPSGAVSQVISASGGGTVVPSGSPQSLLDAVRDHQLGRVDSEAMGRAGREYQRAHLSAETALAKWARLI